jgi:hypothetical protein
VGKREEDRWQLVTYGRIERSDIMLYLSNIDMLYIYKYIICYICYIYMYIL